MTRCSPCQANHVSGACPRCGRPSRSTPSAPPAQLARYAVGGEVELSKSFDQMVVDAAFKRVPHYQRKIIDTIEAKWAKGENVTIMHSTGYGRSAIWDWWQKQIENAQPAPQPGAKRMPCPTCGEIVGGHVSCRCETANQPHVYDHGYSTGRCHKCDLLCDWGINIHTGFCNGCLQRFSK